MISDSDRNQLQKQLSSVEPRSANANDFIRLTYYIVKGKNMAVTLNETPSANRLHIGIFGKTNSGKSSFINAFSGQKVSIVADVAGTTTDPVYKAMEIYPLGPCVLIDTAGFDDKGELGALRIEKQNLQHRRRTWQLFSSVKKKCRRN